MALKTMTRSQLEDKALKLGVEFTKKTADVRLRKRIRIAMKAAKPEKTKPRSDELPKDIEPEMLAEYYAKIVGQPMPDDEGKAYRHLLKIVDQKAPKEQVPRKIGKEPDCFGLYFNEKLSACMKLCPHMPLCRRIVETRPELRKVADQLNGAAAEAARVKAEEAKAALAVKPKAEPLKEKPKKEAPPPKSEAPAKPQIVYETTKKMKKGGTTIFATAVHAWALTRQEGFTRKEFVRFLKKKKLATKPIAAAKKCIKEMRAAGTIKVRK